MEPHKFRNSPAGQLVRAREGYWAFVPHPLPPDVHYSKELVRLLADAATSLGSLVGIGHILPNPHLLIYPYMHQEAVLSSRIEGTQASLSDLYLFEAAAHLPPSHADVLEVSNYVHALQLGLDRLQDLPLSLRLVREIHARLMADVRGYHQTPGEFRRSQNWIGTVGSTPVTATYVPPPPTELMDALGAWEQFLHQSSDLPLLIQAGLMHYQFEAIHPFLDGNGRVGRLLVILFLCAKQQLPLPLLYLSAFFERHRSEYYERLLLVSQEGDWDGWLQFFLRGVQEQARHAFTQAQQLLQLRKEYQEKVQARTRSGTAYRLVDVLFFNPVITTAVVSKRFAISKPAARSTIDLLVETGILTEITRRTWSRVYVAQELLTLLEADQTVSELSGFYDASPLQTEFDLATDDPPLMEQP